MTKVDKGIERSVTEIQPDHAINSGVRLAPIANGLVPIYEEHAARLDRGIDMDTWQKMNSYDKAFIIAMRRIAMAMNNLQNEAEINDVDKNRNK